MPIIWLIIVSALLPPLTVEPMVIAIGTGWYLIFLIVGMCLSLWLGGACARDNINKWGFWGTVIVCLLAIIHSPAPFVVFALFAVGVFVFLGWFGWNSHKSQSHN